MRASWQSHIGLIFRSTLSHGDLVFSFRMGLHMSGYGSSYCETLFGFTAKAVQMVNPATVNYILWGLQVGLRGPKSTRWIAFFNNLTNPCIITVCISCTCT